MSTYLATPASDKGTTNWTSTASVGSYWTTLHDGSDSTDIAVSSHTSPATFNLAALPGDFGTATAVVFTVRENGTAKPSDNYVVRIYQSDNSTQLAFSASQAFASSATTDTLTATLTGSQNAAAWTGAIISIATDGTDTDTVYELYATVTYTPSGGGGATTQQITALLQTTNRTADAAAQAVHNHFDYGVVGY